MLINGHGTSFVHEHSSYGMNETGARQQVFQLLTIEWCKWVCHYICNWVWTVHTQFSRRSLFHRMTTSSGLGTWYTSSVGITIASCIVSTSILARCSSGSSSNCSLVRDGLLVYTHVHSTLMLKYHICMLGMHCSFYCGQCTYNYRCPKKNLTYKTTMASGPRPVETAISGQAKLVST